MKQSTGKNRNLADKFYTNSVVVDKCFESIEKYLNIDNEDIIIEPSAGNGSFINSIKSICNNNLFYDLYPENENIIEQDFLKLDLSFLEKYKNKHFIGNPPFGKQGSIAFKFIKHLSKIASSFSFILPKGFKKESYKNRIPLDFHLLYEEDLPINSFNINNNTYDVPCVFQIWEKKSYNRIKPSKPLPINFKYVKKEEQPDISFRRIGVKAGKIDKNIEKSIQSHYFIKFDKHIDIDKTISLLEQIRFIDNICGNEYPSISKPQLTSILNELI